MDGRMTVGIDVGGTKTAVALLSFGQGVLATITEPTEPCSTPESIAARAEQQITRIIREVDGNPAQIVGIGVGLPGLITPERRFRDSIILPTWRDVDFSLLLEPRLGVPVTVDNDTTMAALGHMSSIPIESRPDCLVCLTLGTGVGGAILIQGTPLRGPDGTAGQLGHMVVDPGGRPCACGNIGCLNAYASGTAIAARYSALQTMAGAEDLAKTNPPAHVWDALVSDDPLAQQAVDEAVEALAIAISNVVNTFNPELIVLGGGVARLGPQLIDPLRSSILKRAFAAPAGRVRICQASYGPLTGAIGAAITAAASQ